MPRKLSPKLKKTIDEAQKATAAKRKVLKTPLRVFEHETLTAEEVVSMFPEDHAKRVYLEPFFTNGCVFFEAMNQQIMFKRQAINDEVGSVCAFFKTLRDNKKEFLEKLAYTPYALDELRASLSHSEDPTEEARRVWIRSRHTLSGRATTAGDWCRNPGDSMEWRPTTVATMERQLKTFAEHLMGVAIDSIPPTKFMDKWCKKARGTNTVGTPVVNHPLFVYLKAPYMHTVSTFTQEDHLKLLQNILSAPEGTKFLVCGYSSELYNTMLKNWNKVELVTNSVEKKKKEMVWFNYDDMLSRKKI
jgi:DNA adenine methylase